MFREAWAVMILIDFKDILEMKPSLQREVAITLTLGRVRPLTFEPKTYLPDSDTIQAARASQQGTHVDVPLAKSELTGR